MNFDLLRMDMLAISIILILNLIRTDAFTRVDRASPCPRFSQHEFPSGKVIYRSKGNKAIFRCKKGFDRAGPKSATCQSDGTWNNDPPLCVKAGCVPLEPNIVKNLKIDFVNDALVKFSCLENFTMIDDIKQAYCNGKNWSAPFPRCVATIDLIACDFEENLCGWTQDDNDDQDWQRNVGVTSTATTGPRYDHTLGNNGNGHYLYFEASTPSVEGNKANLLSPLYTDDFSPSCFEFWFHIFGPDEKGHVGSLEVFVLTKSNNLDDEGVRSSLYIDGNQGNKWQRGYIAIDKQDTPFQIAFVATRARSYKSDIAVDDVRLYECFKSPESSFPSPTPKSTNHFSSSFITSIIFSPTKVSLIPKKVFSSTKDVQRVFETTTIVNTQSEKAGKQETITTKLLETTVTVSEELANNMNTASTESTPNIKMSPFTFRTPTMTSGKAESSSTVSVENKISQSRSFTEAVMKETKTTLSDIFITTNSRQRSTPINDIVTPPHLDNRGRNLLNEEFDSESVSTLTSTLGSSVELSSNERKWKHKRLNTTNSDKISSNRVTMRKPNDISKNTIHKDRYIKSKQADEMSTKLQTYLKLLKAFLSHCHKTDRQNLKTVQIIL